MIKSVIRIFILALITVGIGTLIIKANYNKALETPHSENSDKIEFTIEPGESVEAILTSLSEKNLISDKWIKYAKAYIKLEDLTNTIQAGSYSIPQNLNIKELIKTLQSGQEAAQWVTIREGLRKDEIADILAEELNDNFSKSEYLALTENSEYISQFGLPSEVKNLEGYIFPDRYAFEQTATAESVLTTMVNNFKKKVGTEDSYDTIIVASMVEREGLDENDRPRIAGIIYKRLEEGWTLGLDVTILYYLKTWDEGEITQADLASNNPYNTRINTGLTPTPIANPGLESINAARNPIETEYYYFIRGNDNITHYAVTYQEHLENVANYLR